MDLLAIDISNPLNVVVLDRAEKVFPLDYSKGIIYDEELGVVVDWEEQVITEEVDCSDERTDGGFAWQTGDSEIFIDSAGGLPANVEFDNVDLNSAGDAPTGNQTGQGGSLARFTIVNNHLYAVDNQNMYPFNISNPSNLVNTSENISIGWGIETLFAYNNTLFIGSQNGMFIYSLDNPDAPSFLSEFAHVRSCDPVVVEGGFAYVTLRNGNPTCGGFANQLDVIDISNLSNPQLVRSYDMQNPHGLGIENGTLFICDGEAGLKIYDASNPEAIEQLEHYNQIQPVDVIPFNNKAFLIGADGFRLYDYSDLKNIFELCMIPIEN